VTNWERPKWKMVGMGVGLGDLWRLWRLWKDRWTVNGKKRIAVLVIPGCQGR
jgi:hypothetical protein